MLNDVLYPVHCSLKGNFWLIAENITWSFRIICTRIPWGCAKFFRRYTTGQKKKIKQLFKFILAIVYLVLVTEKGYLKCFVGKKRYSI